jgi:CMP-N-acetylneuraminic acid synthetase
MRPAHLGKDPFGVVDVCLNVLDEYERSDRRFRTLIILLPTSPFRTALDIREAARVYNDEGASFLMSVSEFGHNPFGALKASPENEHVMEPCFPEYIGKKRHEVPKAYRANGAIHIVDVEAFRKANTYYGKPLYTYAMPWPRDIDIDTIEDFKYAEYLLRTGAIDESDA